MTKELLLAFLVNFWTLLNSIAFFILIGVLVAGIFKLLIPDDFIKKHLGGSNFLSNIKAAVLGIPLPLCSCSVIPFVTALRKSGASKSATQTFLIATPITGADSILATYGVFGWVFTIYRLVSSVVIALLAGLLTLLFVKEEKVPLQASELKPLKKLETVSIEMLDKQSSKGKQILAYAFDDIFKDIARSLMIGIIIGAVIVTFMPENLVEYISANTWLNYLLILAISMPLYVCATASIPLSLSLLSAGFSPGAAFIFLTAGPATNTITMSVVLKTLGKASLVIYLGSVLVGSLLFGYLLDMFFAESLSNINLFNLAEEDPGFLSQVSSVIVLYLSFKYIFYKNSNLISGSGCNSCSDGDGCSS